MSHSHWDKAPAPVLTPSVADRRCVSVRAQSDVHAGKNMLVFGPVSFTPAGRGADSYVVIIKSTQESAE